MNKTAMTPSASRQALWFLLVGASAALVHFLILVGVVNSTSLSPAWANVVAFLIAFIVSFFGHFYLTFNQSSARTRINETSSSWRRSLPILMKWFASSVLGFLANQSLFVLGLNWFGEHYYIVIWLIVTGVITVMTFALGKLWAFKS